MSIFSAAIHITLKIGSLHSSACRSGRGAAELEGPLSIAEQLYISSNCPNCGLFPRSQLMTTLPLCEITRPTIPLQFPWEFGCPTPGKFSKNRIPRASVPCDFEAQGAGPEGLKGLCWVRWVQENGWWFLEDDPMKNNW